MMKKDLVSIGDLSGADIGELYRIVDDFKHKQLGRFKQDIAKGKTMALVFEKPSLRTRVSFEVAWAQLGGHVVYLSPDDIGLGKRETVPDVARNLSRWVQVIVARTFLHQTILDLAEHSSVAVINALSDEEHPCQALADFLTIDELIGTTQGIKFSYIGDGNNVCNSLMLTAARLGVKMWVATPEGYAPKKKYVEAAKKDAAKTGATITIVTDPVKAAKDADVIYTDVWASMGQEAETKKRKPIFKPYQINDTLLSHAKSNVMVEHCLPAHRGEEVTDQVLDGPHSVVLHQAENRLHLQKALLYKMISK